VQISSHAVAPSMLFSLSFGGAMKRRDFIAFLGGGLIGFLGAARAEQAPKVPRIGFLYPGPQPAVPARIEAMLNGLRAAGYSAPAQLELVARVAEGDPARISPMMAEIVGQNVDVIFANGPAVLEAARSATRIIPIVALDLETDPVGSGTIASLAHPGGNITGVFLDFPDFTAKWLELLKESNPKLSRVAVFWDPTTGHTQKKAVEQAAGLLKVQLDVLEVRTPSDFDEAFASASRQGAGAVLMLSSPLIPPNVQALALLAARHGLPAITLFPDFARAGGLLAYGPNLLDLYRQVGFMGGKVLQGTKPAELPIERPAKFELVLNLRTAKALGISIPTSVLLRADEVIE
jgi:putative tryptophan/tyrosine transport system substrate-binding protein